MGLPNRRSLTVAEPRHGSTPGAPHPNIMLVIRFLITGLVCLLSLATAIICILVVNYYNTHDPIIRPSWGSLIFLIILGLFTPIIYFGYNIFLPLMPFINYGDFLYSLFMVKIELLLQFAMCVLWVSGALAYANDLRGFENCQFDGYWHYTKPADFNNVCKLINYGVGFAYATFGVQVLLWFVETMYGVYLFLFLDQESLNEPHFEWGRRAYNYAQTRKQSQRQDAIGRSPRAAAIGGPGAAAMSYRDTGRRSPGSSSAGSSRGTASGTGVGRRGLAYNDPEMESRASSQPISLGSRGRRGVAYGGVVSEDEESQIGGRPLSGSSSLGVGEKERGPLAAAAASGGEKKTGGSSRGGSRRGYNQPRRGPGSADEESGWHLREDDSEQRY